MKQTMMAIRQVPSIPCGGYEAVAATTGAADHFKLSMHRGAWGNDEKKAGDKITLL